VTRMSGAERVARLAFGWLLVAVCTQAAAQEPAANWRVRTIGGAEHQGPVSVEDQRVTVHLEQPVSIALEDVLDMVALEAARSRPADLNIGGRLWLRSGVHLPVDEVRPAAGGITVTSPLFAGTATYPLRLIQAVRFPREQAVDNTRFAGALESPARAQDFFLALDGSDVVQRLQVKVLKITPEGVVVEFRGEEQNPVPMERAVGVVFGELTGAAPDPVANPRARILFRSGETLQGRIARLDAGNVQLETAEGIDLALRTRDVRRLEFVTDKLVYLSGLEPVKSEQVPAFDRTWPWMVDRSPNGNEILLGGTRYDRGLVLFPKTKLTFEVGGKFDHFETTIGIEDRAGPQAHAIFRVYADDEKVFESEPLTVGAEPKVLKLPITDAKNLIIEADFGKNFDLGDHCVFADARITQK